MTLAEQARADTAAAREKGTVHNLETLWEAFLMELRKETGNKRYGCQMSFDIKDASIAKDFRLRLKQEGFAVTTEEYTLASFADLNDVTYLFRFYIDWFN